MCPNFALEESVKIKRIVGFQSSLLETQSSKESLKIILKSSGLKFSCLFLEAIEVEIFSAKKQREQSGKEISGFAFFHHPFRF